MVLDIIFLDDLIGTGKYSVIEELEGGKFKIIKDLTERELNEILPQIIKLSAEDTTKFLYEKFYNTSKTS